MMGPEQDPDDKGSGWKDSTEYTNCKDGESYFKYNPAASEITPTGHFPEVDDVEAPEKM